MIKNIFTAIIIGILTYLLSSMNQNMSTFSFYIALGTAILSCYVSYSSSKANEALMNTIDALKSLSEQKHQKSGQIVNKLDEETATFNKIVGLTIQRVRESKEDAEKNMKHLTKLETKLEQIESKLESFWLSTSSIANQFIHSIESFDSAIGHYEEMSRSVMENVAGIHAQIQSLFEEANESNQASVTNIKKAIENINTAVSTSLTQIESSLGKSLERNNQEMKGMATQNISNLQQALNGFAEMTKKMQETANKQIAELHKTIVQQLNEKMDQINNATIGINDSIKDFNMTSKELRMSTDDLKISIKNKLDEMGESFEEIVDDTKKNLEKAIKDIRDTMEDTINNCTLAMTDELNKIAAKSTDYAKEQEIINNLMKLCKNGRNK